MKLISIPGKLTWLNPSIIESVQLKNDGSYDVITTSGTRYVVEPQSAIEFLKQFSSCNRVTE